MSTNVTTSVDIELDTTEVTNVDATGQVTAPAPAPTEIDLTEATSTVEGYKKEYSIVGDGLYASLSVDEAPLWLTSLVDAVVNASIANGMTNYDLLVQDVRNAIDSIDVARNTYVQQIDVTALVDGIVTSKLETLNATYEGNFATKAELSTTVATAQQALAQDINDLSVSFGEDLTSRITDVQTAFADADSALADDITALESAFEDQESNLAAVATATEGLQTYVGLTSTGEPTGTGLLSELAVLQKQADGTVDTFTGMHELLLNDMDGDEDTTELRVDQWPYALWVPMQGTVNPTMTTRTAYKDDVAAQYDIEPHTVYKNTDNNTFWEYHPVAAGGWEEITEPEYASRTTTVRDLHVGDAYIRYQYELGQKQYVEAYKFIKNSPDDTAPFMTDAEGYGWAVVTDNAAEAAYVEALNAYALADGKISQFYAWYHPDNTAPYNQTFNADTADEYTVLGSSFRHWVKHNTLYTKEANHDPSNEFLNQISATAFGTNSGTDFNAWATSLASDGYAYGDHNKTGSITTADASAFGAVVSGAVDLLNDPNGWYHRWESIVRPSLMSQPWFTASVYLQDGWDVNTNVAQGDVVNAYNAVTRDYTIFTHNGESWQQSGPEGIISKSTYFVNLENEVLGPEGHVAGSLAQLKIDSEAYADNEGARVENKFAYDSDVILNGQYYRSGFGLDASGITTQTGDGTEGNAFDSEFWVNAERFVLKSPTYPGVSASFTVTDSGLYLATEHTEATRNEPRGAYSSSTQYVRGDVVTFNNSSYTALQTVTNVTPSNDGTNWQLLASQGMTALLYEWEGSDNWPASTTEASADTHSFDSNFAGNVIIRVLAYDAEGGVRVKFNDSQEVPFSRTLGDNTEEWYQFNFTNLVAGTNTIKFWSSTGDGGAIKRIEVAFVGAEGVDGAYTDFLFTRKSSTPSDPDGADTWYTNVVDVPSGAGDLWSIKKVVSAGGISTSYVDKRVIDAPIIRELTIYSNATSGTATVPTGSTYNFSTDSLSIGTNPTNFTWSRSLPGLNNTGEKIYVSTGLVTGNATQTSVSISWSDPVVYTQKTNGDIYREVMLYANASSSPTKPGATAGWNTSGSSVDIGATDTTPAWTVNPATPSVGELTWRTQITLRQPQGSGNWVAVDSEWGTPVQLTGLSGEATDTIYTVSTTAPATPTASSGVPSGWSATLPTKVDNIWVSIGTKGQGGTTYTWGAPVMLSEHTPNMLLAQKTLPWPIGTGSAVTEGGTWGVNGQNYENVREVKTDPFGGQSVVWQGVNADQHNDADGGFASPWVAHTGTDKLYRFSVFMKQQNPNGIKYFGLYSNSAVRHTGTSTTTNPYFFAADLPSSDEWYMLVGYLKPFGSVDYTVSDSGIYRVSDGVKVGSTNNFIFNNADDTTLKIRCYQYYNTEYAGDVVDFWGPRIDVMDDRAPTITDLLRKSVQGQTYKEIFLYANAAEAPELPPVDNYFDATTGSSAVVADATWTPSVGSPDTGESTWRTSLTLVKVSDQTPWTNHDGSWNTAIKVSGHDGVSYTGTTEYYKLTNSDTAPDRYSSGTTIDTGWSTSPSSPTSSNRYLWNFNRNSRSDGSFDDSSVSLITSMVKSISSITEYYQLGTSATTKPTDTWQTSIANAGAISDSKPYLWNKTVIAYTDGSTSTTTYTLIAAKGAEGYTPVKGTDYFDGAPGSPGAGFYHTAAYTSTSSTNSTITSRFTTVVGRAPVAGDVFTQEASDGSTLTKRYDGSEWVAPSLIVDGSMIVDGSVTADHLAVNSLSAVNADMGTVTAGKLSSNGGNFVIDLDAGTITISV